MATKSKKIIRKRKPKAIRVTKNESFWINQKYIGTEPTDDLANDEMLYARALNWYSSMASIEDAKGYLKDYLIKSKKPAQAKAIVTVDDSRICTTAGWIVRILDQCSNIPNLAKHKKYADDKIAEMLKFARSEIKKLQTAEQQTVSVRDRMIAKSHEILGEVEGLIDDHKSSIAGFSLFDWLTENSVAGGYCNLIVEKYTPVIDELYAAWKGKDKDLVEGYAGVSKQKLKNLVAFYWNLILDCNRYSSNSKKEAKPRKARVVSTASKLKHFVFMKENADLNLVSVKPDKILGASELWMFNTKNNVLSVFRAADRGGLQIKRRAIVGFSDQTSVSKRAGRKLETTLKAVVDGGKVGLRKVMDKLGTDLKIQNRCNENTILLRVIQ